MKNDPRCKELNPKRQTLPVADSLDRSRPDSRENLAPEWSNKPRQDSQAEEKE
jgi:hypothetical protein